MMMSGDRMDVDGPSTIKDLLKEQTEKPIGVESALSNLTIKKNILLSQELRFLKQLEPKEDLTGTPSSRCGMTLYSLEKSPGHQLLELEKRKSNVFIERSFYADLYDKMVDRWKTNRRQKIILTGNAGTGKSWFQVSVLRRLLGARQEHDEEEEHEEGKNDQEEQKGQEEQEDQEDPLFRFVVRHVGKSFFLIDLRTCSGYKFELEGHEHDIKTLCDNHGGILYMYEPATHVNQSPLLTSAASLSTLSPRPTRIEEYVKSSPIFLYMPVWEFNELEFIAGEEKMDLALLDKNFSIFGGIARYTLERDTGVLKDKLNEVDKRCGAVTADILRSITAGIDDDPKSTVRNNISGFVVSYTDIPREGEDRFSSSNLTMASEYVRATVFDKMSLKSPLEHLDMLLKHLDKKSRDITGKDLEVSVVHLLAAGPKAVPWEYHAVGETAARNPSPLRHRKRGINRETKLDQAMVNYPFNTTFPLTDCFVVIGGVWWAFQTTWQIDHAFKLATLLTFRKALGLSPEVPLNILFVNPAHAETYRRRAKDQYLAKGEQIDKPILDRKKEIILDVADVANMWDNTHIYVACPKGEDWQAAIRKHLGIK